VGKPIKVLSIEQLAKWKKRTLRRLKKAYNFDDKWAERRLLDVIKSHEGLRRGIQQPFSKPVHVAGQEGGFARAKRLTPERRSEIARAAAHAMWAKKRKA